MFDQTFELNAQYIFFLGIPLLAFIFCVVVFWAAHLVLSVLQDIFR